MNYDGIVAGIIWGIIIGIIWGIINGIFLEKYLENSRRIIIGIPSNAFVQVNSKSLTYLKNPVPGN